MKALVVVLALIGCKGDRREPAPPTPTPAPTLTPTPPEPGCEMKISMNVSGLSWTGPHGAGAMADGIDPAKVSEVAREIWSSAGPCAALISADDKVVYRDVVIVMDAVIQGGIRDVALDLGGATAKPPRATSGGALESKPIVAVTPDAVMINGLEVGKLADAALDAKLAAAYADAQHKTPGAQIILQADKSTSWASLARVVGAARTAGFSDVLFAVKNQ